MRRWHRESCEDPRVRMRLVPGFTLTARSWDAVERSLPRDWDIQSVEVPDGLDFVATADTLGHRGGRAVWVGYSMGARLCLRLALDNPRLVEALALVSGTPGVRAACLGLRPALDNPRFGGALARVSGTPGIRAAGEREARRAEDERRAQELEREGGGLFLERWRASGLFGQLPRG